MNPPRSGGGWQAIRYTLKTAMRVGPWNLWRAMRSKNTCKTCALGMGGQQGGMHNESGHFPEFCKKSLQAMAADMQGRIEDRFFAEYSIAQMRGFSPREMEMMGRLVTPLYAGAGDMHYRPISWGEALSRISGKLKSINPQEAFFYSSGRSSNEAGFLLQLFARIYGTNHVNNCSYYCHQASGVGLTESIGSGTATIALDDLEHADLFFLIGGNPASNHPRLLTSLMRLRNRGGKIIVINPVKEPGLVNFKVPSSVRSMLFGTQIASLYLQPKIGGDIALMSGIAKALLEFDSPQRRRDAEASPTSTGATAVLALLPRINRAFIADHTEGFEAFESHISNLKWDDIEKSSGVPRSQIEQAASLYAESTNTIFGWTMGITHHEHGVHNVQWIVNLALLRGMIGKPRAGLLPIRGHSNVQGLGSIAVTPALKQAVLDRLHSLGISVPDHKGHDTLACMNAAHDGQLKFGLCLGGNLYGSNPDSSFASAALAKLDMLIYLSTTLNTGHAHALGRETMILPVLPRDEEPEPTTQESMFNFVRLSDGGPPRHAGPRSEVSVLADLAQQTLPASGPVDWKSAHNHDHLRSLIAQIIPGWEQVAEISKTKEEFHLPNRIFHAPQFLTKSGRARFFPHAIPALAEGGANQFRLMTVRSEGQFNTVVYEEEDIYRGQDRRDVILLNAADMERLGLKKNQLVTVQNETGRLANILARPFEIVSGCALMYYPEANVLVPRIADPQSKTPAFKSAVVTVEASMYSGPLTPLTISSNPATMKGQRETMKAC